MKEKEAIPEAKIKEIISSPMALRTKALIIALYACGCRIGELIWYHHKILTKEAIKRRRDDKAYQYVPEDYIEFETVGLLRGNITDEPDRLLLEIPNFKNKKQERKSGFILKEKEGWMYKPFKEYLDSIAGREQIFTIKEARARQLVREALKAWSGDVDWSSHYMRHSRATHLIITRNLATPLAQRMLGHGSLDSTMVYTHIKTDDIIEAVKKGYKK